MGTDMKRKDLHSNRKNLSARLLCAVLCKLAWLFFLIRVDPCNPWSQLSLSGLWQRPKRHPAKLRGSQITDA